LPVSTRLHSSCAELWNSSFSCFLPASFVWDRLDCITLVSRGLLLLTRERDLSLFTSSVWCSIFKRIPRVLPLLPRPPSPSEMPFIFDISPHLPAPRPVFFSFFLHPSCTGLRSAFSPPSLLHFEFSPPYLFYPLASLQFFLPTLPPLLSTEYHPQSCVFDYRSSDSPLFPSVLAEGLLLPPVLDGLPPG